MEELIRTNDVVLLSFAQSLLKDSGIVPIVADEGMSVLEGSLGLLPRRLLVTTGDAEEARALLAAAGLGGELRE
ncbi:putative signal transducing protein [Ensifer soli]|uniref:putative signal transducing protein n=1 Tax=Ciceribacter sp. sgz301302 TaxID=3342379 RepID=UPI0035B9D3D6